jgi:hypothetical protein
VVTLVEVDDGGVPAERAQELPDLFAEPLRGIPEFQRRQALPGLDQHIGHVSRRQGEPVDLADIGVDPPEQTRRVVLFEVTHRGQRVLGAELSADGGWPGEFHREGRGQLPVGPAGPIRPDRLTQEVVAGSHVARAVHRTVGDRLGASYRLAERDPLLGMGDRVFHGALGGSHGPGCEPEPQGQLGLLHGRGSSRDPGGDAAEGDI